MIATVTDIVMLLARPPPLRRYANTTCPPQCGNRAPSRAGSWYYCGVQDVRLTCGGSHSSWRHDGLCLLCCSEGDAGTASEPISGTPTFAERIYEPAGTGGTTHHYASRSSSTESSLPQPLSQPCSSPPSRS